jgi:hypothetical protein
LKNVNLFVDKISSICLRGFRSQLEGEDDEKHRVLNEATLRVVSAMERNDFKWSQTMTNEMLPVNGLKYLFSIVEKSQIDDMVEMAYNCLIMIAKANEMISFVSQLSFR